ncbi:MAG: hypothetical protein ACE5H3_01295, partial [Planctomycetota bacterium]
MRERVGTCTRCGQRYGNIPPTLKASRVRCTHCGGVVEIVPLPETSPGEEDANRRAEPPGQPPQPSAPPSPPQARPIGKPRPQGERPSKARPVDRRTARPAPPIPPI